MNSESPPTMTIEPRRAVTTLIDGDSVTVLQDQASPGDAASMPEIPSNQPPANQPSEQE